MATDYAGAVRNGTMAAARLHVESDTRANMQQQGGSIDVFNAALGLKLPLLLRPLKGLLGAYIPDPIPGVLITTERPLSIQRFTAAHELGHYRMKHRPSLDDENILRRMTMTAVPSVSDPDFQEVEADAFAVAFVMPRWLIEWHCHRQGWLARDLARPGVAYQLTAPRDELRSYELDARALRAGFLVRRTGVARSTAETVEDRTAGRASAQGLSGRRLVADGTRCRYTHRWQP